MAKMVGLSRSIKLEWLNKVADLVVEGKSEQEIKNELNEYLSFEIKSPTNLRKTREILMYIWIKSGDEYRELRYKALEVYKLERSNKLAIHWCLMIAAYPVFADVCSLLGKLTNIQDTFTTSWLKEKLFEVWGERSTLLHSSDKILQTLKYIGAIENLKVGTYQTKKYVIKDSETITLLIMTIMLTNEKAYFEVAELPNTPQMFPFEFVVSHEWLHNSNCFSLNNFGGKVVLVKD
jgi:hypothetical protein